MFSENRKQADCQFYCTRTCAHCHWVENSDLEIGDSTTVPFSVDARCILYSISSIHALQKLPSGAVLWPQAVLALKDRHCGRGCACCEVAISQASTGPIPGSVLFACPLACHSSDAGGHHECAKRPTAPGRVRPRRPWPAQVAMPKIPTVSSCPGSSPGKSVATTVTQARHRSSSTTAPKMIFASGSMTRAISLATVFTCCRDIVGPPVTWRRPTPRVRVSGGGGDGGREVGVEGGLRWTERPSGFLHRELEERRGWRRSPGGGGWMGLMLLSGGSAAGCWGSAWGALRCGDETGGRLRSGTAVRP